MEFKRIADVFGNRNIQDYTNVTNLSDVSAKWFARMTNFSRENKAYAEKKPILEAARFARFGRMRP